MVQIPSLSLSHMFLDSAKPLLPRNPHKLHRRDASPGIIGIVVGLAILITILGAILFRWNWNHFKQAKSQKDQKQHKKQHHAHSHTHHHRHSHRRHRAVAHHDADLEENQQGYGSEQEEQDHSLRHHPDCRHFRLHHRQDPAHDWTPQQPEPAFHPWGRHRQQVRIPNEMDAPQIHRGWERPSFFG
ncbi:hypothetical protein FVEN_g10143 [Fusarium venenatum]|uniref:Uncharacterized protein n=1 Tax=Fusarium venenatum TaxID=56646 RepID=A0A2L2TXK8_9HYPO|nr:uncharacterized protein FVRRES_03172 [Fusarium venenatum]KAG8351721.1 hypothetical protein FVEN_g10143 [Fusarium venenatum]CEI66660.1 unnamed protein product [Fusarium venenatum]